MTHTPADTPALDANASTTDFGIFDLARVAPPPREWMLAVPLAALALVGSVAFLGQYRPSQVTRALAAVAPLPSLMAGCTVLAAILGLVCGLLRRRWLAVLAAGVVGYLAGHWLFAALPIHEAIEMNFPFRSPRDGPSFALHRIAYGLTVAACAFSAIVAAGRITGARPNFHLGLGSWSVVSRAFTRRSSPESYSRALIGFVVFSAVLWLVGQASAGFHPIRSGALWSLLGAILLAALVNAAVEELLFRGMLQPAIVGAAGVARGLWIQGMLFGLMHWGASVGVLAALPTSLLIGVGAVYWGKAVLETKGLSWVILAHAMVDVAVMCAYFVPRTGN